MNKAEMCGCKLIGAESVHKMLMRYNGIGKPLSGVDREILLFALYNESEARPDGIAAKARAACEAHYKQARVVQRAKERP